MSTTRTWKCPQCGASLEISYDWLAEHGGPVCEHCDCDMDLQPAADSGNPAAELLEIGKELLDWADMMGGWDAKCWTRLRTAISKAPVALEQEAPKAAASDDQIERLVDKADAAGLEPEDLDEIVHEFAASVAADVNNGGLDDQIRYLVDGIGVQQTERQLDDLIDSQPSEEESDPWQTTICSSRKSLRS